MYYCIILNEYGQRHCVCGRCFFLTLLLCCCPQKLTTKYTARHLHTDNVVYKYMQPAQYSYIFISFIWSRFSLSLSLSVLCLLPVVSFRLIYIHWFGSIFYGIGCRGQICQCQTKTHKQRDCEHRKPVRFALAYCLCRGVSISIIIAPNRSISSFVCLCSRTAASDVD